MIAATAAKGDDDDNDDDGEIPQLHMLGRLSTDHYLRHFRQMTMQKRTSTSKHFLGENSFLKEKSHLIVTI